MCAEMTNNQLLRTRLLFPGALLVLLSALQASCLLPDFRSFLDNPGPLKGFLSLSAFLLLCYMCDSGFSLISSTEIQRIKELWRQDATYPDYSEEQRG